MKLLVFLFSKEGLKFPLKHLGIYKCYNNNYSDLDYNYRQRCITFKIKKVRFYIYSFLNAIQKWDNSTYGYTKNGKIIIKIGLFKKFAFEYPALPYRLKRFIENRFNEFLELIESEPPIHLEIKESYKDKEDKFINEIYKNLE